MALACIFLGVLFLIMGVMELRQERRMRRHGIRVTGTVLERVFKPEASKPSGLIVRYTTRNGNDHETQVSLSPNDPPLQPGDLMSIVYNPNDLREVWKSSRLDGTKLRKCNGGILLGTACLAVAAVVSLVVGF